MMEGAEEDASDSLAKGADEIIGSQAAHAFSSKTVLTLFGGDRQAKQLFSSLGKRKSPEADDLSEHALPNGISTTEIIPTHSLGDGDDKKDVKFRENFPPPSTLPPLPAPRPSQSTTSRSGPVTWYTPSFSSGTTTDPRTFATQRLPTGTWLNYNAPPPPRQQSPETKRKQRDRALSFGEAQLPTNDEATAAHIQAKDDALFRSVYTSFAPDRDDSVAIIPTRRKDWMWYTRYGQETYQELLDAKHLMLYGDIVNEDEYEDSINEEDIQEALNNWSPPESAMKDLLFVDGANEQSEQEANEVLAEVSNLLETLSSYQRIRNETLPTATRSSTGSVPAPAGSSIQPASPSTAENEAYEALKAQMTSIVASLPPYMLSKLDGDKLGALNVSTRIQTDGKNQKGTLQEDELSVKVREAARAPISAAVTQTPVPYPAVRGGSGYSQQTQTPTGQYTRPPYGAPASASRPGITPSYPSSHYAGRPPAGYPQTGPRPPYAPQGSYGGQRQPSYTDRYANGAIQYGTPQNYSSYTNGGYRASGQPMNSYTSQYSSPRPGVPASAAAQLQAYRATQSEYQQRAAGTGGPGYAYGSTPTVAAGTSPQPAQQHRLSFSTQGRSPNSQRPSLQHQHSSHHGSHSPQPQTNGAKAGVASRISPDEQAVLMSRQKAQLAEAAQQIREGSRTPQPATQNGGSPNGTPGAQHGRG